MSFLQILSVCLASGAINSREIMIDVWRGGFGFLSLDCRFFGLFGFGFLVFHSGFWV